jgi:Tn3 transposase DDE domain
MNGHGTSTNRGASSEHQPTIWKIAALRENQGRAGRISSCRSYRWRWCWSSPTYQAMIEVGRAQRTLFAARYLRDRALQREINEGLNVVESWHRANSVIFFGKGGDIGWLPRGRP